MRVDLRNNMDFLAGLLMVVVGGVGFYMALDYPFGSALRMGPGFFPRVLAGILIAFGLFVGIRGLFTNLKVEGVWGFRALGLITIAFWLFGWLMDRVGFVPSLAVLIFVSARAGFEFKLGEVAILTAVLTAFAYGIFIYGLGLPYPLFWWS